MAFTVYTVPPIPPDPDHTTYVEAGGLRIGVESRLLDESELDENYEGADLDAVKDAVQGEVADLEDDGVSLHVVSARDGKEYLRFDCFRNGPHYHYIEPSGERQTIVDYDAVAMGEMLPWAIAQLRERLGPMLEHAGGGELVPALDLSAVGTMLDEVERLATAADQAMLERKRARS